MFIEAGSENPEPLGTSAVEKGAKENQNLRYGKTGTRSKRGRKIQRHARESREARKAGNTAEERARQERRGEGAEEAERTTPNSAQEWGTEEQ